jgi:hypothetical protein
MKLNPRAVACGFKRYPVLFTAVVVCIPLAIICFVRDGAIIEQQAELEKNLALASLFRANIANSSQLQQQVDFLVQAKEAIAKRAFRAESLPLNLQYFYKLETDVGIKYLTLNPTARTVASGAKSASSTTYIPLNFSVSVQGSFHQIITYLRCLEQGAYFCRINSASVLSSGSIVTLNLDLDLLGIQ